MLYLQFDPKSGHVGFVADRAVLGKVFLQVLQFPMPTLIPQTTLDKLIILLSVLQGLETNSIINKRITNRTIKILCFWNPIVESLFLSSSHTRH
jgi:hypothetical protein